MTSSDLHTSFRGVLLLVLTLALWRITHDVGALGHDAALILNATPTETFRGAWADNIEISPAQWEKMLLEVEAHR